MGDELRCCFWELSEVGDRLNRCLPALVLLENGRAPLENGWVVREAVDACPVELVTHASTNRLELVEDVETGQRDAVEPVDVFGIARSHAVEPATAPRAPGRRAELVRPLPQVF